MIRKMGGKILAKELFDAVKSGNSGEDSSQITIQEELISSKDLTNLKDQLNEIEHALSLFQNHGSQDAQSSQSKGQPGGAEFVQQITQFSSHIQKQQQNAAQQLQQCIQQGVHILNQTNQYFEAYQMLCKMQQLTTQTQQQLSHMKLQAKQTEELNQIAQQGQQLQ
jgi:flagellar hook-basal body complex protein FliE